MIVAHPKNTERKALRLLRELHADMASVRDWYRRKYVTTDRHGSRARLKDLWDEFTQYTADAVRRRRVGPDTTLEGLLALVRNDADLALDERRDLCEHHCVYVGTADRFTCMDRDVVSVCVPHPDQPEGCAVTLCFDLDELDARLHAFEASGAERMPNPAAAAVVLPDNVELAETLDPETVEMLRWQVLFAKERRAMQRTTLDTEEKGILMGVVLPMMAHRLRTMRGVALVLRLYHRFTPGVVRRMLSNAGNALLYLLEHPYLNLIAIVFTKTLRMLTCLFAFGVSDADWKRLRRKLLDMFAPSAHFAALKLSEDTVNYVVDSVKNLLTGDLVGLGAQTLHTGLVKFPKALLRFVSGLNRTMAEFVGFPRAAMSETLTSFSHKVDDRDGYGLTGMFGDLVMWATGNRFAYDKDGMKFNTVADADAAILVPYRKVFAGFWHGGVHYVACGIVLWMARSVSARGFLEYLRGLTKPLPVLAPVCAVLERAIPKTGLPTLHAVLLLVVEQTMLAPQAVKVLDLVTQLGGLMHCAASFLLRRIAPFLGEPLPGFTEGPLCCQQEMFDNLVDIRRTLAEKLAAIDAAADATVPINAAAGAAVAGGVHWMGPLTVAAYGASAVKWVANGLLLRTFCDRRLKRRVRRLDRGGGDGRVPWYAFEWNARARRVYGLRGRAQGPMADEVRRVMPWAVYRDKKGYDCVDLKEVLYRLARRRVRREHRQIEEKR